MCAISSQANRLATLCLGVANRRLARSQGQQDLRLLVDGIEDYGIFILAPSGVVLTWNSGAERMQGYKAEEIVGHSASTFYLPSDVAAGKPALELAMARDDGRFEHEGWCLRKDGTCFWARSVFVALYDGQGGIRGFGKVTRDLTERRTAEARDHSERCKAEDQLRASQERFRLMVESVKDFAIIMMLDPEGRVLSWNAGAEPIDGWTAEEVIGQGFERFYPREEVGPEAPARELIAAAELGTFEDYSWRVRKDGTRFWANVVTKSLRDERGVVRGFSRVTRDVTERKQSEEEVRKAYEELESFSYSVSHDLRAPLRSMNGFSSALCDLYGDKLDGRGQDYLGRIRQSAQRMARLIDDLLNLARLGRAKLDRQPIDLTEMSRKIVAALQRAEPCREVQVVVAPGLVVCADANLMRVVLEKLIGNAWKYTSHHVAARIEVGMQRSHGQPVYFVRDDGAGFDMTYREKLFGAFQRLHAVDQFPGTGIGLATVKRVIHRHGGEVWASGEIEHGATFNFSLGET